MILDQTWNKKNRKLTVSYIDKDGNRKFWQKYIHHIRTYEYSKDGEYDTWNNRKANVVFKSTDTYKPNEFDLWEMFYELPKEDQDKFYAMYFPKLYTFDIETEVSNEFPDPFKAKQKVTSISIVAPDLSCIVMGLTKMTEEQQEQLKTRYLDWISKNNFAANLVEKMKQKNPSHNIRVLYQYCQSEEELLQKFFTTMVPKIAVLAGWNSYNFDWNYLYNRAVNLFGEKGARNLIYAASPTREITNISWVEKDGTKHRAPAPSHSIIVDYMELCQKYDYTLTYESYSLDWVSSHAVGANKIKYDGTLQQLYERDTDWYYFYNAIDSLLIQLIHHRLKCIESPCASAAVTLVTMLEAYGQVKLTTANVFKEFYNDNKHVVFDYNEIERFKKDYAGAFCGCVPGRYDWNVCDDFKSLYPSQVITCNFSFENFYQNMVGPDSLGRYTIVPWTEQQLEEFRKDKNYFVSINGNVYKNDKDYAFRRIQANLKVLRDKYKYTGQRIESELLVEIDNILNHNNNHIDFHQDIVDLIKEKFNKVQNDLYNMTEEELKKFKVECEDLRHEYSLLELAHKVLMNGLYGACANQYFYFFNAALAADITGECRQLTKNMWHNLEEWFHEGIWERKDLWEKFDFKLDESKHDWFRTKTVSCYSDTDSVYVTFGNFFRCMTDKYKEKYNTARKKVDWILKYCKEFQDKLNNKWCEEMYNPRNGKNVHEFELETISYAQICIKKKKYLKGYAFVKGKFYDEPKVSGTGIEIIKSTTPKLCRKMLKELMNSLMFEYDEDNKTNYIMLFNNKIQEYRKEFYKAQEEDISQSVGIGDYKKYVIDDTDALILGKQCPVSVQAIARFNHLAHKNGEDNKKQYSGKIKYYNIRISDKNEGYFGFPSGELPEWAPKMDKITQWQKTVIDPINRFLEVMDIPKVNASSSIQLSLF